MTDHGNAVSVLPMMEGAFLVGYLHDNGIADVQDTSSREAVALGEAPIAYEDAMSTLRSMRKMGIYSIAPIVMVSDLDQEQVDGYLANVKQMEEYICWRHELAYDSHMTLDEMREYVQRPMTEGAIAIFDQMERNALTDPFQPPFPIR